MCLITSYLDCNSRDIGRDSWTLINEIASHLLYKQGKLSPIKSCVKLELCSSFEYRIRLWHLTHECSFILTWFFLHMEHLDLPSLILLDQLPKMCEIYLLLQIKVYLLSQYQFQNYCVIFAFLKTFQEDRFIYFPIGLSLRQQSSQLFSFLSCSVIYFLRSNYQFIV